MVLASRHHSLQSSYWGQPTEKLSADPPPYPSHTSFYISTETINELDEVYKLPTTDKVSALPVDPNVPEDAARLLDQELEYVGGWKLAGLMIAITLACFLVLLDMSIIVTAIPRITSQFHSLHDVGWYGSSYNLASAALQPLSGKFYTYFRTKWTFLIFLLFFELGSLICGLATSSIMLIIGRAIAGLGSAGIQNGGYTIIAAAAPLNQRPALMGLVMGGCQVGLVSGPLLGGAFTEYLSWRWCFYINLPIGAVSALLLFLVQIPDRRIRVAGTFRQAILPKLDLIGFAIFAPSAVMMLLALEMGGKDYKWGSPTIIGLFFGGVVTAIIFLNWESRRGLDAMIPLHIIKKREIWTSCLSMVLLFTTIFTASYYFPIYFQSVKGASPFMSGVYMLPSLISQLLFAVVSGLLTQRIGYYTPFALVSAVASSIGNGLISTFSPGTTAAEWIGYQVIVGFGRGMGMQIPVIAVQANTDPDDTSIATALLVFCQTFGGAVYITVANAVFNIFLENELKRRVPHLDFQSIIGAGATGIRDVVPSIDVPQVLKVYSRGVSAAFWLAAGCSVLMFIVSWGMGWKDIRVKNEDIQVSQKPQSVGNRTDSQGSRKAG